MVLYAIESNIDELDELAVTYDNHLVLSTGLIMWIDHCKEIRISLRWSIHIIWSSVKWRVPLRLSTPDLSFRVRKSHLSCLRHNIQYIQNRPTRRRRISTKAKHKKRKPPTDIPTIIQGRFAHNDSCLSQLSFKRLKLRRTDAMKPPYAIKDAPCDDLFNGPATKRFHGCLKRSKERIFTKCYLITTYQNFSGNPWQLTKPNWLS